MSQDQSSQGRNRNKRRPAPGQGSGSNHNDISLSKKLSYLLRHGAPKEKGVKIHAGGYVNVDEILRLNQFKHFTPENIKKVVEDNDKQRFTLRDDPDSGELQICANQGHSFQVNDLELEPVTNSKEYPTVIHGTNLKSWNSIKQSGLRRMNRIHIHFAPGEPGDQGVISGMRNSAQIYIYVDISKAISDGIKFYKSKNNVILSPGNENGVLDVKYFAKVVDVKTKQEIPMLPI